MALAVSGPPPPDAGQVAEEESEVSLLTLPSDSLHIVCFHTAADVCSLAALGSVCKLLALATAEEDLWRRAARARGVARYHGLSWRAAVSHLHLAEATLRQFVVRPPTTDWVAPRRLRCHGKEVGAHANSNSLPLRPIAGLVPLTHMEREWLAWFRRYESGSLHVEVLAVSAYTKPKLYILTLLDSAPNSHQDVLVGRTRAQVVHFHDCTEACVACAVQTADGQGLGHPVLDDWPRPEHVHRMRTTRAPHVHRMRTTHAPQRSAAHRTAPHHTAPHRALVDALAPVFPHELIRASAAR